MGVEFFTDFKSSNGIEISRLVQVLLNFDWFRRSPPLGGWGGWMGWDFVRVFGGMPHAHTHTCMCTWVMMSSRDSPGFPYGSSHLHEITMFIHVCTCVHACVCMCMHAWDTPKHPDRVPTPSTHPPQGGPEISQKSIKIERIEIFEFCLKILDLWRLVHSYRLHLVCSWEVSYQK